MTVELGVIVAVGSLVIAYLGYQLNRTKSVRTDSEANAQIKSDIGYIRKSVDDIRIDIKANEKQMAHLSERVTRVEESSKQAHKRIDNLEDDRLPNR